MFKSLFSTVRSLPAARRLTRWRRDLASYWFACEKGSVAFVIALGLPVILFGFLIHRAYIESGRIESKRHRNTDLTCLARNIYFEARGEPISGQYAVAEVTLNRVASTHFPDTVCEVVYEKKWDPSRKRYVGAFSWTELHSDSTLRGKAWQRALAAAEAVYDDQEAPRVNGALFYHANSIQPRWAKTKKQTAIIGKHIFYQ